MGINARQVRGDSRTEELQAKNDKEIMPVPEETLEYAESNVIHIFNVSPYSHKIEHPSVGVLVIPACKPGESCSEPAIVKGYQFYGVPTDMQTVEIRHDSGRLFALDVLGLGPFRDHKNSLVRQGVFIATGDTLDLNDLVPYRMAPKVVLNVPRWVKSGKTPSEPTQKELARANREFEAWDWEKIKEADRFWDAGPANKEEGSNNIRAEHREALRRRGQTRPWDQPLQSLVDCPGCGEKVKPGIIMHHACGYIFDMDKAIRAGMAPQQVIEAAISKAKAASEKPQSQR
jgi:hypothetical protein